MTTIQIVAWSCWGGFIVLVLLVSAVQLRKLKHRETGMRTWPHIAAVVVGHREVADSIGSGEVGAGQLSSFVSIYEYTSSDGRSHRGRTTQSKINPPPAGQQLLICVNPDKPAESYPVETTSRVAIGCVFVGMGAFCVAFFFFLRLLVGP